MSYISPVHRSCALQQTFRGSPPACPALEHPSRNLPTCTKVLPTCRSSLTNFISCWCLQPLTPELSICPHSTLFGSLSRVFPDKWVPLYPLVAETILNFLAAFYQPEMIGFLALALKLTLKLQTLLKQNSLDGGNQTGRDENSQQEQKSAISC